MLIVYLLIFLTVLWGLKLRKEPSLDAAVSVRQGTMLKGVFVLLVFASHVGGYLSVSPADGFLAKGYLSLQARIGQLVVVPFLFFSGYGLRVSIAKKGRPYLRKLPRQRILRIYLHALVIITLFLAVMLFLGDRYTAGELLAGYLLWGSFGNSTWYIFCILLLYLFTWFSFSLFKQTGAALGSCLLLTLAYFLIISRLNASWWYDTVFVFCFGLVFPELLPLLRRFTERHLLPWLGSVALLAAAVLFLTYGTSGLEGLAYAAKENLRAILVMLLLILLLERLEFGNRLLDWVGKHVFGFYLLQRLPMILLKHFGVNQLSAALFVSVSVLGTVLLVVLFDSVFRRMDRLVFRD